MAQSRQLITKPRGECGKSSGYCLKDEVCAAVSTHRYRRFLVGPQVKFHILHSELTKKSINLLLFQMATRKTVEKYVTSEIKRYDQLKTSQKALIENVVSKHPNLSVVSFRVL